MAGSSRSPAAPRDWPVPPPGRDVVLHTRVVTGTGGGPDKTILLSASALADSRYWPAAAYLHPPDDPGFAVLRRRAAALACPLIGVPDAGPLHPPAAARLLEACRRLGVRVWHAHDYKSNLLGLLLRPLHPMRLVTTVHGWVSGERRARLYYALDRRLLRHYDHVICVSDDLLDRARRCGVPPDRCTLLPNAVDTAAFRRRRPPDRSPLRARLGVPEGRLVVGAAGRLSAEKALEHLVEAGAALGSDGPDFEVWIAGEGPRRAALEALIDARGLRGRARLLGFCSDPAEFFEALDLFVLSSIREGLPNVVLEALAMEVPVVSTAVAGVPRLIRDGRTGLLAPVGDVPALATAMARALRDGDLRADLARAGRALVEAEYDLGRRMRREQAVYDLVLGHDRRGP
jgi:glycosyltransferase involved in cell wall biosynthesis